MMIQVALVRNEMLCRGAVVRGKLFHTSKILFGPAMNDVYILESKVANYPRVILEESIINTGALAHAKHHGEEFERESILKLLSRDGDGLYYIDYLTKAQNEIDEPLEAYPGYVSLLRKIIARGLKNADPSVRAKYFWMKEKFSPHLAVLKAWGEATPADNEYYSGPQFPDNNLRW